MAAADSTGFAPLVESGKLRVLNTWGEKRLARFPDAPTLKELGLDIVQNSPFGIGAPKGTPPDVVKKLHDAFKKAMEEPSYVAALARYDMLPIYMSSAAVHQVRAGHLRAARRRWSRSWGWPSRSERRRPAHPRVQDSAMRAQKPLVWLPACHRNLDLSDPGGYTVLADRYASAVTALGLQPVLFPMAGAADVARPAAAGRRRAADRLTLECGGHALRRVGRWPPTCWTRAVTP